MIEAIHHVQVTTPAAQLEETMRFYRDVLGLPLAPRPTDMGRDGYWFRVFDRDLHLGIEEDVDRNRTRSHIAYKVDDLAATMAALEALGIPTKTPAGMAGYRRLHVRDPAGNLVELIQPLRNGMDVDRKPWPKVHVSVALVHAGKLLMVREGKPESRDKWNLPGGHAERSEFVIAGALRELLEETGVTARADALLGIFSSERALRLIVLASADDPRPIAGDEILESRFWSIEDAMQLPDEDLMKPKHMREAFSRLSRGVRYPLDLVIACG